MLGLSLIFAASTAQADPLPAVQDRWLVCVYGAAEVYALEFNEPVAAIADMALGKCEDQESGLELAIGWPSPSGTVLSESAVEIIMGELKSSARSRLLAHIADWRIKAKSSSRRTKPAQPGQ